MEIERITHINDEVIQCFKRLIPQLSINTKPPSIRQLEEIVAVDNCYLLATRENAGEDIIGTLTLIVYRVPTGVQAWIEDVVVDEKARGKGAGKALIKAALDIAAHKGAKCVSLTSRPARQAANQLYLGLGFTIPETNYYRYAIKNH
jgi:ribosomal protein S18 acetylase RimI-like enzyme